MSPAGSRTKSREGKRASSYIRRGIGDLIKLFQALSEKLSETWTWLRLRRSSSFSLSVLSWAPQLNKAFMEQNMQRLRPRPSLARSLDAPPQHASSRAARWLRYYQRQRTEKQRLNIFSGTFKTRPLASLLTNVTPEDVCIRFYT